MKPKTKVQKGSNNLFADVKHQNPIEALTKAKIASYICELISSLNLTQSKLAKILRIDQPRVSDLVCGRLSRFSTQKLLDILTALDQDIEIHIKPRKKRVAEIRVIAA